MEYLFDDVLEIKNGKNQKAVENPTGQYPIYGSGGVMGYADDYICDADTVIKFSHRRICKLEAVGFFVSK